MADLGNITVIGSGNMGGAIIAGLVESKCAAASSIMACDRDPAVLAKLQQLGVSVCSEVEESLETASIVVLAVKPNIISDICLLLREPLSKNVNTPLVVSIVAGISTSSLSAMLGGYGRIARVMPNLSVTVKLGCSGVYALEDVDAEVAECIFETIGKVVRVNKEQELDAVTGLSGSGPGFVFLMIEALQQGGVAAGLAPVVARELAAQTVLGAASMLIKSGEHPAVLRDKVTTAGGTTIAGIAAMEECGVRSGIIEAVVTATERAQEIGEEFEGMLQLGAKFS